ncbi:MAG: hypothetical protein U5Q03_05705 [Bacteroidota bacterium]|nr:hypothetical protein [Bacteroidota bacterium]
MADIYPCPQKMDSFHGYEVYATDRKEVTIINFSGKPLYIPVSHEDFKNVVIAYWQHKVDEAMNLEETHNAAVFDNSISFEQSQINSLKEELSAMSIQEKKRQGIYDVNAFETFNNASGLMPEEYKDEGEALVRINPDLVDEHPEKIQLLSMHWYLLNQDTDEPRLYQESEDAGLITNNKLALIYSDSEFWKNVFQILRSHE